MRRLDDTSETDQDAASLVELDSHGEMIEGPPVRARIDTRHVDQVRAAETITAALGFAAAAAGLSAVTASNLATTTEAMLRLLLPERPDRSRRTRGPLERWTIERIRTEVGRARGHFLEPMDIRTHVAAQIAIRALMVVADRSVIYEEYVVRPVRTGARQKTAVGAKREANESTFVHLDALTLGGSDRQLTAGGWGYVVGTNDSHAQVDADVERIAEFDAQVRRLFPADVADGPMKIMARFEAVNGRRYPGTAAEALSWQLAISDAAFAAVSVAPAEVFESLHLADGRPVTRERFLRAGFNSRLVVRALPHGPSGPGVASSGADAPGLDEQLIEATKRHGRQALLYAGALPDTGWPRSGRAAKAELPAALPLANKLGIESSPSNLGDLFWSPETGELARRVAGIGPTMAERWSLVDLDVATAAALIARCDLSWPVECLERQENSAKPGMMQPPTIRTKAGLLHLLRVAVAAIVHEEREGRTHPDDKPPPTA